MRSESAPAEPSTLLPALLKKPGAHGLWSMASGGRFKARRTRTSPPSLPYHFLSLRTYQKATNLLSNSYTKSSVLIQSQIPVCR